MEHSQEQNRRRAYRYQPEPVMEPIFSILHGDQRCKAERVIDINARGARVAVNEQDKINLAADARLRASIMAPGLDGCVDIEARVVFNAINSGQQLLALAFDMVPDVADRIDPAFFRVFNRRGDMRSSDESSISAVLVTDDEAEEPEHGLMLNVVNHSDRGIGFMVDEHADIHVRGRKALRLTIASKSTGGPHQLTAHVQHRATRAGAVYYGCSFAA